MAISTYSELQTSVADFLNRDDLTTIIPDFITMAEAKFDRELRHWRMETRSTATLDSQYSAIPDQFLEPVRLSLLNDTTSTMELVGTWAIADLRAKSANRTGKPEFYAILDGSIEVQPTPDGSYNLEMVYYSAIDKLSASNTTNWLLDTHPDAYLYGALLHSAPYLQEDNRVQVWAALYQSAIDAINMESDKSKTSGSGRRIKIRSYS